LDAVEEIKLATGASLNNPKENIFSNNDNGTVTVL
jgi:hypothetical protein